MLHGRYMLAPPSRSVPTIAQSEQFRGALCALDAFTDRHFVPPVVAFPRCPSLAR
ncbi:MAG: hypothetical protein KatS3mg019_0349 [Fimbriimonadales bacterium]|nr:MAG: hypothetical protein KatS3mg019_0349 [Fimbriimonadales bacterium]